MQKFIAAISEETDPSNKSSQKTTEEAINYLAKAYARSIKEQRSGVHVLGCLEKEALQPIVEFYLRDQVDNVDLEYVRDDLGLIKNQSITHVIFNRNETSPGPIILLSKIVLVMPGEMPEKLYYENCSK